jgi:hypothetical protein
MLYPNPNIYYLASLIAYKFPLISVRLYRQSLSLFSKSILNPATDKVRKRGLKRANHFCICAMYCLFSHFQLGQMFCKILHLYNNQICYKYQVLRKFATMGIF